MTTAPALMSCPNVLCDAPGEIISIVREYYARNDPGHYYGYCVRCCCRGPVHDTPEQAIAAWNARPGGDEAVRSALSIACDRLQEFLDTFGDMRDYVTQSDIDDWRKNALRTHGASHD